MKVLRAIRFDASDLQVFPSAAEPGEILVPGAFVFAEADLSALAGKDRQAFRNGFLGVESFGFCTLAAVAEIDAATYEQAVTTLTGQIERRFRAPSRALAEQASRQELADAATLCAQPINTLIALEREAADDGIRERFRIVEAPRERPHARIWDLTGWNG